MMHAPEDRGDVPNCSPLDDGEGGYQFRPSSGLQVDVFHCLVRGHLLDELGRTSRKCGGCFHCHSWTPHPMEKEATIIDDHDDDVFDANASGDEYTDSPGDVATRLLVINSSCGSILGLSPSMLSYCCMYT